MIDDGEMVERALAQAGDALIVAADGGVRVAEHYHLRVNTVIGDMDSLTPMKLDGYRAAHADSAPSGGERRNRSRTGADVGG